MVVRMRATRAHRNNRRSHHALTAPAIVGCQCGTIQRRHVVCGNCGKYRGRQVINIVARAEAKQERLKRKAAAMRESGEQEKVEKKAEAEKAA